MVHRKSKRPEIKNFRDKSWFQHTLTDLEWGIFPFPSWTYMYIRENTTYIIGLLWKLNEMIYANTPNTVVLVSAKF